MINRLTITRHQAAEQNPTWTGFEGPHAVSDALLAAGFEADSVTEGSRDVGVAERHHLQHPSDARLQVSQQLLQRLAHSRQGTDTKQGGSTLADVHVHILKGTREQVWIILLFIKTGNEHKHTTTK